jgi:lipoprotein-anchoring transpeptidase ErfK/SrfK
MLSKTALQREKVYAMCFLRKVSGVRLLLSIGLVALAGRSQESADKAFAGYREGFCYDTLALQVQLDRRLLSCNCIDGVWGAKTATALMTWQLLNGMNPTGVPTGDLLEQLGGTTNVLTHYTVTEGDLREIAPVPEAWEEKARLTELSYETVQEMLAERGHTSMRALERLNPELQWPNPPSGSVVALPACEVGDHQSVAASVRISLERREITVFDYSGRLIALFPCSIAKNRSQRPSGEIFVKNIAENPNYLYDPQLFNPGSAETAKLTIAPGPNNPVGSAWIGLSLKGYGIHGTPVPERIGEAASHGCFRLANWNARRLIQLIEIGTPVVVEE